MRVFHRWEEVPSDLKGGPLVIGNFDGLHLGHLSLLECAKKKAAKNGREVSLLTFFPHPVEILFPDRKLPHITTASEKLALLSDLGIDSVIVAPFTSKMVQTTAEDFFEKYVWATFAPSSLHVGSDFHFGKGREGNEAWLRQKASEKKFELCLSPLLEKEGVRVSSTAIRKYLAEGDVVGAQEMLGRPYSVSGQVEHGDHRGSGLGFPTANVSYPDDKILPKNGVYVTQVYWQKEVFPSITNVGVRPTIPSGATPKPRIEVHLLDFNSRLYDEVLTVHFLARVRDEKKFGSLDELKTQVNSDIASAKRWFEKEKQK